ncbi:hypothetical protein SCHPADRAFT_942775 [Schizopora paradoxa]|uniref:Metaxin glutathione S-transferase domain-containing protein n=1 Tax=Schizopora paradoxa TaxID=27342 RepID=A0A0H2RFI9_9AGAM|nr:hypothetical protein SCHPADRAFT_942775 [Schizopora paradoxa]
MASTIPIPVAVHRFFAKFPLHIYPDSPLPQKNEVQRPSLWIAPPKSTVSGSVLSSDVECLKWQAYIALRGVKDLSVRWDVTPDGSVDGRLPSLQTADRKVLGARMIPGWVDDELQAEDDAFEGYKDATSKDESRAWVALLEGIVHTALTISKPSSPDLKAMLFYTPSKPLTSTASTPLSTHLSPPAAPISGISSIFPVYGERVSQSAVEAQYHDAIVSLSDRLGNDEWFLGSSRPTALDALAFAYLHCLLAGSDPVRVAVARKVNLVNWERRVQAIVQASCTVAPSS